ncbi:MAG: magnesium/cobalt transporter CorA, partial [Chloroflexi bacterium]
WLTWVPASLIVWPTQRRMKSAFRHSRPPSARSQKPGSAVVSDTESYARTYAMRTLITIKGAFHEPKPSDIAKHLNKCEDEGFWLDVEAPDKDDYEMLTKAFDFHPLTIDDVKHGNQRPKLEEYKGYSFMVLFDASLKGDSIDFDETYLYLAKHYLVTIHRRPLPLLLALRKNIETDASRTRAEPMFLTYLVVDQLVDANFPVLEQLDETIDELQDKIIDRADPEQLRSIYALKHDITKMRQRLGAQRDMFQRLISASLGPEDREMGLYYRDVYDHVVRQYEAVDSHRDLLTGAMDVYLSTVSNRLNVTMKALTVIASVFLPLSFLTGFYGMNFALLTQVLEAPYLAFWVGIGTMVAATVIQLYFFRRRGWI